MARTRYRPSASVRTEVSNPTEWLATRTTASLTTAPLASSTRPWSADSVWAERDAVCSNSAITAIALQRRALSMPRCRTTSFAVLRLYPGRPGSLHDRGRRVALLHGLEDHFAAARLDSIPADDLVGGPVGALH